MSANVPFATELTATNANLLALAQLVAALTARVTIDETAFKALAAELIQDEALIAALTTPAPAPVPPPVVDPQVQWRASMETADLSAWSEKVNTGPAADSTVVLVANEGIAPRVSKLFNLPSLYAMKQSCSPTASSSAGTRMARYPEIDKLARAGTPFYYSWWDFFPSAISIGFGGWYNHWQIASNDPTGKPVPLWVLGIEPGMIPNFTSDPTATQGASKTFRSALAIPVGQWNFFEVYIVPRPDATGALKLWLNGQLALDISGVQTQFALASQSLLTWVTSNAYGMGLSPVPFIHFLDDVTLSLGRMP